MLKVIVLTALSTIIENLPAALVSPPLVLLLKVILTFCKGAWVVESATCPMIILVWAAPNLVHKTAITHMVKCLQIGIDLNIHIITLFITNGCPVYIYTTASRQNHHR